MLASANVVVGSSPGHAAVLLARSVLSCYCEARMVRDGWIFDKFMCDNVGDSFELAMADTLKLSKQWPLTSNGQDDNKGK
jgi:hypothetical protein